MSICPHCIATVAVSGSFAFPILYSIWDNLAQACAAVVSVLSECV